MGTGKNFPSNSCIQGRSVLNLEEASVFGLLLWLYDKALIDQLVWSIRENIQTSAFRTDLTETSLLSVRTSKLRSEYFPVWTSQLVNKSILLLC